MVSMASRLTYPLIYLLTCLLPHHCLAEAKSTPELVPIDLRTFNHEDFTLDSLKYESKDSIDDVQSKKIQSEYDSSAALVQLYTELPVDHWNRTTKKFRNKYYFSDRYYKSGGPVFLFDRGERKLLADSSTLEFSTTPMMSIVQQFGGAVVMWEHRYYGASVPIPFQNSTTFEEFQFHTTDQALLDVAYFANNFTHPFSPDIDLSARTVPWIFVGYSYAGTRAALIRERYPDTIYASYSSSAPVLAQIDMSSYHEQVWRGLRAQGWTNCSNDAHAAITYMDKQLDSPQMAQKVKERLLGSAAAKVFSSNAQFATLLRYVWSTWQSDGIGYSTTSIRGFCNWISTNNSSKIYSDQNGWAAVKGPEFTIDRWASWKPWQSQVQAYIRQNCLNSTSQASCNNITTKDPDSVAWSWQSCTEWGFFQIANLGDHQIISKYYDFELFKSFCHSQFGDAPTWLFPDLPNVNATNKLFGGDKIRPSNTYWTQGEFDPWRMLSPFPPGSSVNLTQTPPKCGASSQDPIFGYVIPNATHAFDKSSQSNIGNRTREYFAQALTEWLPCFTPKSKDFQTYKVPANSSNEETNAPAADKGDHKNMGAFLNPTLNSIIISGIIVILVLYS